MNTTDAVRYHREELYRLIDVLVEELAGAQARADAKEEEAGRLRAGSIIFDVCLPSELAAGIRGFTDIVRIIARRALAAQEGEGEVKP